MITNVQPQSSGIRAFIVIWITQLLSILASQMTSFALAIWVYKIAPEEYRVTAMVLQQTFFFAPFLAISLFAGAMVDRYDRKLMMMMSDLTAGVSTAAILILYAFGQLEIWHLYVATVVNGLGSSFQWPAYSAVISLLVPKEQLGRVNGMMSLLDVGPGVIAPFLAGILIGFLGAQSGVMFVMGIDVVTFIIAIIALLLIYVPQPPRTTTGHEAAGNIWHEALYGFRYIFSRPSMLGLQLIPFSANLFASTAYAVLAPMILSRTDGNQVIYGTLQSVGAIGGILGGLTMSVWGGPKKRVHGVLTGWMFYGLLGTALIGFKTNFIGWFIGIFIGAFLSPIMGSCNQAIWQSKVPPDVQGRVFSARRIIAFFFVPFTAIIAGPLSDFVLEPAMKVESSTLSTVFSNIVGTGPGSGMALIFVFCGLFTALVGMIGYLTPLISNVESIVPDHDAQSANSSTETTAA